MKSYFRELERVKSSRSHPVEIFYLAKGWKLVKDQDEEISKEHLKEITEKFYSTGFKSKKKSVDADLEAKIRSEIGDFDKNNPNYEYLKDDDENLKHFAQIHGNPSFNTEVPNGLSDLPKVVEKMKKEKVEPAPFFDEELDEMNYEEQLQADISNILSGFENSDIYNQEDAMKEFTAFQHEDFMKEKAGENMEGAFKDIKDKIYSDKKRAKNNPTKGFEDWKNAEKDPEFWNN